MSSQKQKSVKAPTGQKHSGIALQQLVLGILLIVFLNIIGSFFFTRFDLTSERRYTLSDETRNLLKQVNDYVFFRVYLEGDFPAGFKRLRNETREMLDEMRAYNKYIGYEFINPGKSGNPKERENVYRQLVEKGLNPTDLQVKSKDGESRQIIFPGAIVTYGGRQAATQLLYEQAGTPPEEVLNLSVQNLEFNLASTIHRLIISHKPRIAFIYGHGELKEAETRDISQALSDYYTVERLKINENINAITEHKVDSGRVSIFNKYKAIIIAKPDSVFSERDKFIIDQFVMRGGRVLWFIDGVKAEMDSLQGKPTTLGLAHDINLEDMFFRYGVRVNSNLLLDLNCLPITLVTGQTGNQPRFSQLPWFYFPLVGSASGHPMVNNINVLKTQFVSSLDTIAVKGIKKTFLLSSGQYSRTVNAPVIIDLNQARTEPDVQLFNRQGVPVAVLLEGRFESLYNNRIPAEIKNSPEIGFMAKGRQNQMIVVADGDIIRNQLQRKSGLPLPLGYDQDTRQMFGNKDFVLNAMNYLVDDSRLVSIRSREVKMRLLDRKRVEAGRLRWQTLNLVLPVILVLALGLSKRYLRKRKYAR